jgi:hypothetical protein
MNVPNATGQDRTLPLSSMSREAGVSSSVILLPSYKNLAKHSFQLQITETTIHFKGWLSSTPPLSSGVDSKRYDENLNSPNAGHILANLVCIRALKLAELRIALNLEEYFISSRAYNLPQTAHKKTIKN